MQQPLHGDAIEATTIPTGRRGAPTGIAASSNHGADDQRPMGSNAGGAATAAEKGGRDGGKPGSEGNPGMEDRWSEGLFRGKEDRAGSEGKPGEGGSVERGPLSGEGGERVGMEKRQSLADGLTRLDGNP